MPEFQHGLVGWRVCPPSPPPRRSNRREASSPVQFTDTQEEILFRAWLLARDGRGQVLEDWAEPDAEELCEAGWLERRTVNDTDDIAYFWTREAEGALDIQALRRDDPADLN
jgi:hypothetical protein